MSEVGTRRRGRCDGTVAATQLCWQCTWNRRLRATLDRQGMVSWMDFQEQANSARSITSASSSSALQGCSRAMAHSTRACQWARHWSALHPNRASSCAMVFHPHGRS